MLKRISGSREIYQSRLIKSSFYYCFDDNDDTLDRVKLQNKSAVSLTSHVQLACLACWGRSVVENIVELTTYLYTMYADVEPLLRLRPVYTYTTFLVWQMIDYIFQTRCIWKAALFSPWKSRARPRESRYICALLSSCSLRHSPRSFRPVNYTWQFVMLIHNYTLYTIAVRPSFRPTLRRVVLLSPTYIWYTGCSKHCVHCVCERTCTDCAKIRGALKCVSHSSDM